jgi:hypothetical protein
LVSTLITGSPSAAKACFWEAMWRNCSSRSGHRDRTYRFRFAFIEKPICFSIRRTVFSTAR